LAWQQTMVYHILESRMEVDNKCSVGTVLH
jgi:hypothetical protein